MVKIMDDEMVTQQDMAATRRAPTSRKADRLDKSTKQRTSWQVSDRCRARGPRGLFCLRDSSSRSAKFGISARNVLRSSCG